MKRIKKINEDWSNDYTYDFTDAGFEVEENGNLLTGKYKGQFVHSDISSWFEEMLAKLSDEQKVVRSKTYFNELTGNASFEVEIKPTLGEHSIEVEMDGTKYKFYLGTITSFIDWIQIPSNWNDPIGGFYIGGNLESGQERVLWIGKSMRGRSGATKSVFHLGNRTRGISVSKEDVKKVLDLIDSDDLPLRLYNTNNSGFIYPKYSELNMAEKHRIDQIKLGLLKES
jgi:hypothetical protein